MAGTKMTHIPYKGTGPALTDLLGGQIQLMFGAMPAMVPQHKGGRLRGIAVTTAKRNVAVPDIPTDRRNDPRLRSDPVVRDVGPERLAQKHRHIIEPRNRQAPSNRRK